MSECSKICQYLKNFQTNELLISVAGTFITGQCPDVSYCYHSEAINAGINIGFENGLMKVHLFYSDVKTDCNLANGMVGGNRPTEMRGAINEEPGEIKLSSQTSSH